MIQPIDICLLSIKFMAKRKSYLNGYLRSNSSIPWLQFSKNSSISIVDDGAVIDWSRHCIWHFSHICAGAVIGKNCSIGQNVLVANMAVLGNGVKIQNNVAIYGGITIEDDVFLDLPAFLHNVTNPRKVSRKTLYEKNFDS